MTISGVGERRSKMVYNVEKVVIKTLDDDVGWMIARKIGATAAKAVAADQIRQKNELAGFLAAIAMRVSDRADLRQWSTLPKDFQIARTWLPAGQYTLTLQGLNGSGFPTPDLLENIKFSVRPGHKTFLSWRSLR